MKDSVKFFDPITMRSPCDGEQDNSVRTERTMASKTGTPAQIVRQLAFMSFAPYSLRSSGTKSPLQPSHSKVREQRQNRCRDGTRQNDSIIDHCQSAKDEFSQSSCADSRSDRGQANRDH